MKKIILVTLFSLLLALLNAQDLPAELFKNIDKCLVKTQRILPNYDLHRSYMTTKSFYDFYEDGRTKEITNYGGNDSYEGYYTYTYSDSLDERIYFSNHNIITQRLVTRKPNRFDYDESLYSWGGKLVKRIITETDSVKHQTIKRYYNDAGYPLFHDVIKKFPDGRNEKITTNDYDGFPVYYTYFNYNQNLRLDSERKIDYADSLISIVEYDYDEDNRLLEKAEIDFSTNTSTIERNTYDMFGRLALTKVSKKTNKYGGEEIMIMKREFIYDNYQPIDQTIYKVDEARIDRDKKLNERFDYEMEQQKIRKAKEEKARIEAEKKAEREKSKLEREKKKIAKKKAKAEAKAKEEAEKKAKEEAEKESDNQESSSESTENNEEDDGE